MNYRLEILRRARKQLSSLPQDIAFRIDRKIALLQQNPFHPDCKKIVGTDFFRVRVGDYRIVYRIQKNIIEIGAIGHRREIYR